jgi:hypothetical protein
VNFAVNQRKVQIFVQPDSLERYGKVASAYRSLCGVKDHEAGGVVSIANAVFFIPVIFCLSVNSLPLIGK